MRIQVGQVFRVSQSAETDPSRVDFSALTRGSHASAADINKGIWAYKEVRDPNGRARRPAVLLLSNRLESGTTLNPWVDVIEPDDGYALYHGDNRTPGRDPFEPRGNRLLLDLHDLYSTREGRPLAPPLLVFDQEAVDGRRKGYRTFSGFGVPGSYRIETQGLGGSRERFTNLVVEIVLFGLESEAEVFDWSWIDRRRDRSLTATETLKYAPVAWQRWVRDGDAAFDRCRRRVFRRRIEKRKEQLAFSDGDAKLLAAIHAHYQGDRHCFEGLAALIAQRVIGERCERGWVTKRSGDGGIDFVARLDVGAGFAQTSTVVLGQAKCVGPTASIGGKDLARVVARLRRGWIGVFVTTGYFSEAGQAELHEDEYPVILVNGRDLVKTVRKELAFSGLTLDQLIAREDEWYRSNLQHVEPQRIVTARPNKLEWSQTPP